MTTCDGLGARQVLEAVPGLTYRQLDYWTRTGRLRAHQHNASGTRLLNEERGRGHAACWPQFEIEIARRMILLIGAGFTIDAAATIADDTLRACRWHDRRNGVYLLLEGLPGYQAYQADVRELSRELREDPKVGIA